MNGRSSSPRGPLRLGELAERLALELRGDPEIRIESAATLASAGRGQISFLANPAYLSSLKSTRASAVIASKKAVEQAPCATLVGAEPYAAWARALTLLHPPAVARAGIDSSAQVDAAAAVDPAAEVGPLCHIGAGARIGPGVVIGPGCVVEADAVIDAHTRLAGNVFIARGCRIGQRVLIHPGVVIGADGFGLAMHQGSWIKVPQLGAVEIGDDCEIGANTTVDRGAIDDTVLGCDVRLDNQVQIGHNVVIGDHTAIAGCVGVAGSTRIGRHCMIAGACGIGGHLEICDHVVITAMSTVLDSISEPGKYGSGIPARPQRAWQRILVRLGQIDRLFR